MDTSQAFIGTADWLQQQWTNPRDIFTLLLLVGGDIVQMAIAQTCAGPWPFLTPVAFSFGWLSYAVSSLRCSVGENRLMPKPELDTILFNVDSGYGRKNYSWVLSRILRDFDFWQPQQCREAKHTRLKDLRTANEEERVRLTDAVAHAPDNNAREAAEKRLAKLPDSANIRIGLRVAVFRCSDQTGSRGRSDVAYWAGVIVSIVQLAVAAVPWACYGEWFTFLVTGIGTVLAYSSGALPQWKIEKTWPRQTRNPKRVVLTEGNGSGEALLLICASGGPDFEAMASRQRELEQQWPTRAYSFALAVMWLGLAVTVAGWNQQTWFLVGIGLIGMFHNVCIAGWNRYPKAYGLSLELQQTIVERGVMDALYHLEQDYPGAGLTLAKEFYPGRLWPREKSLWNFAGWRKDAWINAGMPTDAYGSAQTTMALPPLRRPANRQDDLDIPDHGPYE